MFIPLNTESDLSTDTLVDNAKQVRITNVHASNSYSIIIKRLQDNSLPENDTSGTFSFGTGSGATFDIDDVGDGIHLRSYSLAGINAAGTGYKVGDVLRILGSDLNGNFKNDAVITVTTVGGSGEITGATITGTGVNKTTTPVNHTGKATSYVAMQTDSNRVQGVYGDVSYTTNGSGTPGKLKVTVNADGGVTGIQIKTPGLGDATSDIITIADSELGNGGAPNVTFAISGTTSTNTYQTYSDFTLAPGNTSVDIKKASNDKLSSTGGTNIKVSKIA